MLFASFSLNSQSYTGCPKKHGNSVTNWISSLLWISIVIPNFKSHNIIMYARVYFMKRVKDCKDVFIMSPEDEQWRRTSFVCLYTAIFNFTKYNRMQSKLKQIVNKADVTLTDYSFLSRYHYTKSKNYLKDDIEFVTEFPCLLGHPVEKQKISQL